MASTIEIGEVTDTYGDATAVTAEYDLATGGWKVRIEPGAHTTGNRPQWLTPDAAEKLAAYLVAAAAITRRAELQRTGA